MDNVDGQPGPPGPAGQKGDRSIDGLPGRLIKNPEVSKDHQADLEALNLKVKKETIETLD